MDHITVNHYQVNIRLLLMGALAVMALIGSMLMGQLIPELLPVRAVIAIPFVLFLPGFLGLKVLNIRSKGIAGTTIMALGLSIAMVMLLGLFANFVLPLLGVDEPLSVVPITALLVMLVAFLVAIVAFKEEDVIWAVPQLAMKIRPYHLYLVLIPIVTLLGVALQNTFSLNIGLIISILMMASTVVLASFGKIPKEAYPLTIFLMALSLLLHTSLISDFLWGWDIHKEFYSATDVINTSSWNYERYSNVNAMLSLVALGPTLSMLSGASMEMVFRVVYPFIFSFMPVGLYILYLGQTNEKVAFLSVFFIISMYTFFIELPQLARQEVAELFVVLILLVIIDKDITSSQRTVLFVLFSFSLIVSHYATNYFFMTILIFGYLLEIILRKRRSAGRRTAGDPQDSREGTAGRSTPLRPGPLLLMVLITVGWYTVFSSSSAILSLVELLELMFDSIVNGMFNSDTIQSIDIIRGGSDTLLQGVWMLSQIAFGVAMVVGALYVLRRLKDKFNGTLVSINCVALAVLAGAMVLPHLASSLNTSRVYHLALLFLAPYVVIGAAWVVEKILRATRPTRRLSQHALKAVAAIVIFSLAFNAGLISAAVGDGSTSFALNKNLDFPRFDNSEVAGAKWTAITEPGLILADEYRMMLFFSFAPEEDLLTIPFPAGDGISSKSIIYFGKFNIENDQLYLAGKHIPVSDATALQFGNMSRVYANGHSEAWYLDRFPLAQ